MRKVAVIGGGPSGLAMAKALLENGCRSVVFEAANAVGGLWSRPGASSRRVWESMRTNLTKYSCHFSDLPWSSESPLYPSNQEVHDYLQRYTDRYLAADPCSIRLNTTVTRLSRDAVSGHYTLYFKRLAEDESSEQFDDVVIASGFFAKHDNINPHMKSLSADVQFLHSDDYHEPSVFRGRHVLIAGGSFSGCEIAAEIATVAARVTHVVPHYAFVLPRFIPQSPKDPSSAFLPLDIAFYELSEKQQQALHCTDGSGSKSLEVLFKDPTAVSNTVEYFKHMIGAGNARLDPLATLFPTFQSSLEANQSRPCVTISDEYKSAVRSGVVQVLPGRLSTIRSAVATSSDVTATATHEIVYTQWTENGLDSEQQFLSPQPVDYCILCTGYQPDLSYLDEDIQQTLQLQPKDHFQPLQLFREILHPKLPGLYFVGMYKGPYFGVIELQAKLVAQYLSGRLPMPSPDELARGLHTAAEIRSQSPRPQFPHSDYVGLMCDLAQSLGVLPEESTLRQQNVVTPSLFCAQPATRDALWTALQSEVSLFKKGKYIARAVLYALEGGRWSFHRDIFDKSTQSLSSVDGHVDFSLIRDQNYTHKHLWYHENGVFSTAKGGKFDVSQSYVYAYNADEDYLEISFSTVGAPTVIDRHFLSLFFKPSPQGWTATAKHLCGQDNYHASFTIAFAGINISSMDIVFDVLGPAKDYRSTTHFELVA